MKTSELTGSSLDWAVAKARFGTERITLAKFCRGGFFSLFHSRNDYLAVLVDSCTTNPSTNWAQAGPIIEKEKIGILFYVDHIPDDADEPIWVASCGGERALGHTPLIAAMRCYVLLELGKDVEIPEELI